MDQKNTGERLRDRRKSFKRVTKSRDFTHSLDGTNLFKSEELIGKSQSEAEFVGGPGGNGSNDSIKIAEISSKLAVKRKGSDAETHNDEKWNDDYERIKHNRIAEEADQIEESSESDSSDEDLD